MKKLQLCILGSLFAASLQAQSTDYTKGLSIWFDTPNNFGRTRFLVFSCNRQSVGKQLAPHRKRQFGRQCYGIYSGRTNHFKRKDTMARRTKHRKGSSLLLERK